MSILVIVFVIRDMAWIKLYKSAFDAKIIKGFVCKSALCLLLYMELIINV